MSSSNAPTPVALAGPTVARGAEDLDRKDQKAVRAAMLSVYYHSIGRRLEIRGAPAVLLPPEVEPLPLGEALTTLKGAGPRMREAIWTIARAVPAPRTDQLASGDAQLARYPSALIEVLSEDDRANLRWFDRKRGRYRRDAHLFGAALVAFAESDYDSFKAISQLYGERGANPNSFNEATAKTRVFGGDTAEEFLAKYFGTLEGKVQEQEQAAVALQRLEQQVGLNLPTYAEEFADTIAFVECFAGTPKPGEMVTVFPASSVTVQDAASLLTRVTVTALVRTSNFHCLRIGTDPQSWSSCSDAFRDTRYVASEFEAAAAEPSPVPGYYGWTASPPVLEEKVTIAWGADESELCSFHNILNVKRFEIDEEHKRIDLDFDLNRCIKSRILWDERPGGILVDEGFARVRPLGPDLYRVTVRKTIRFSDRTPYAGGPGWHDFGQLLNYIAPATLSWWIESELYSTSCPAIVDRATEMAKQR